MIDDGPFKHMEDRLKRKTDLKNMTEIIQKYPNTYFDVHVIQKAIESFEFFAQNGMGDGFGQFRIFKNGNRFSTDSLRKFILQYQKVFDEATIRIVRGDYELYIEVHKESSELDSGSTIGLTASEEDKFDFFDIFDIAIEDAAILIAAGVEHFLEIDQGLEQVFEESKIKKPQAKTENSQMNNSIFIIHGHDVNLKTEVELLLKNSGLAGIVLKDKHDKGRTIIEKFIDESESVGFAVALLTPDDLTNGKNQARPNVILEIGYFLGKLGRPKVLLLKRDELEIPSNLSGILYKPYDAKGVWKINLLKEISEAGIKFNLEEALAKITFE